MPPKKVQQQSITAYIPFYVLPLFISNNNQINPAQNILRNKNINVKKCIDQKKIIQILKDKGLQKFLSDGKIQDEGRNFVIENLKTVMAEYLNEVNKPVDTKKQAKKDTKKDTKKQQAVVEQKEPLIQLNLNKKCNDFYFYLDFPKNPLQLEKSIKNGIKIDAVIIIQEKVKKGSNIPNFNILGKTIELDSLMESFNNTKISANAFQNNQQKIKQDIQNFNQIIQALRKLKSSNEEYQQLMILDIPFQKDIGHPQNNQMYFINSLFTKLSQVTIDKQIYQKWAKQQVKAVPMIQPLKQIIKKQVQIQNNANQKGKKDPNKEPQFQTIQQVVETRYQILPENIKSNLSKYKQIKTTLISNKNNQKKLQIKQMLQICLKSISNEKQQKNKNNYFNKALKQISQQNLNKKIININSVPAAKLNNKDFLSKNLRKITTWNQIFPLAYNLINEPKLINQKQQINMQQILHKDSHNEESLMFEFMMMNFNQFMNQQEKRIKFDFSDRNYRQKLTKQQISSEIQNQVLKDPKIYQGFIPSTKIKLLCLAKINPPGRLLYNNDIFDLKSVPNFQYWFKNLKNTYKQFSEKTIFDYKFSQIGNLSIKRQKYMPNDCSIITDQSVSIGNQIIKINFIQKQKVYFGLKKQKQNNFAFWLTNQTKDFSFVMQEKQHQFIKQSTITQEFVDQGTSQKKFIQKVIQSKTFQKRGQFWIKTKNYILGNNPYPTLNWLYKNNENRFSEVRRDFGPKGQITCYYKDGSFKIYYTNGNISTFKNNKWSKIIKNICINQNQKQLTFKQQIQGDKIIKIREDGVIFINYSNGNTLTVFNDSTRIFYDSSKKLFEIMSTNLTLKQQIIIRIYTPKDKDKNIIGHGSAFSYLGYNNILQRSYDRFLYQFWSNNLSSHLYIEKYQYQNKLYEEQIRLVYLNDGSIIKVQEKSGKATYVQRKNNSNDNLRYQWNQIFNTEQNHQEGVYRVNLKQGFIKTKDSQSNTFKIKLNDDNQVDIAVSFKIGDQEKRKNQYGNGFHVPQQNYFLPAPSNIIPARLFSFDNQNGNYYEYLNQQQLRQIESPYNQFHIEQISRQSKIYKQYTKINKNQNKFQIKTSSNITFSQIPNIQKFNLPALLLEKETVFNMKIQQNPIKFRLIEKISWNKNFEKIKKIQQQIKKQREQISKEIKNIQN